MKTSIQISNLLMQGFLLEATELAQTLTNEEIQTSLDSIDIINKSSNRRRLSTLQKNSLLSKKNILTNILNSRK